MAGHHSILSGWLAGWLAALQSCYFKERFAKSWGSLLAASNQETLVQNVELCPTSAPILSTFSLGGCLHLLASFGLASGVGLFCFVLFCVVLICFEF